MCGVIAALGARDLTPAMTALAHRGPDDAESDSKAGISLAHTRLAIRDPLPRSRQPYTAGPVTISYNGELFNTAYLKALCEQASPGYTWATTGDTEVLAAALHLLGPAAALAEADGMFGLAWADQRTPGILHLARDRHGEIPLHLHKAGVAASELKAFRTLGLRCGPNVTDVTPGQWWQVTTQGVTATTFGTVTATPRPAAPCEASGYLSAALATAVDRRVIADVPVCTLLSGGIDSAAITLELTRHHPGLVAYTAVLDRRSRDLRCARETADLLGIKLIEIPVQPPTADDLAGVVSQIELPHKAQVEIGWPCLALAAAMNSDGFKVTYTGEGSDELWASYGFAYHGLAVKGWYAYRRDLIRAQARKNFPRINKAFLAYGVEARLPFLDPDLVTFALSLPREAVQDGPAHPKAVLQRAYTGRLPNTVTSRPKVAFQDGLGLKTAIMKTLPDPGRFYRAEYATRYG